MQGLDVITTGGVGVITSIISAWLGWFFTRRKYRAEVDSTLLKNLSDSLEFYKHLSDDNTERLDRLIKRNAQLELEVRQLRIKVNELSSIICTDLSCRVRVNNSIKNDTGEST